MPFSYLLTVTASAVTAFTALIIRPQRKKRLIDALDTATPARSFAVDHRAQSPIRHHKLQQQITAIFTAASPRSEAEQQAFATVQWATLAVGLGLAGLLFFPLQIAAVLCMLPPLIDEFKRGYHSLVHERRINANVLNAVLVTGSLAGGFFLATVVAGWFIVLVRWLALKTEDQAKQGIINLFGQQVRAVWVIVDGVEVELPVEQVQVGNLIALHAGQMSPMDGVIVEGYASIDQRMLTGEAQPAEKGPGDPVLAATIVLAGRIAVRVEKAGEATTAAQIGRILTDTTDFKKNLVSRAVAMNDQMALPFLLLGGLSWPLVGPSGALGILMVAPGYRMALYGPLSMLSYLHLAVQQGILIKDGRSLELLQAVDTVVFDKTGTLTLDQPHVSAIHARPGFSQEEVLTYAATAETKQSHPIARAILAAATAQGLVPAAIADAEYEIGYGITVRCEEKLIRVGSPRFMALHAISLPPMIQTLQTEVHSAGHSLVLVAVDGVLAGAVTLQPTLRPEAQALVQQLRARGLHLYIISGDHDAPTRYLANELGMDGYFAEVLPDDKAALVKQLQDEGRTVCFVGDGINDAIALKTATVSISLRGAATIATDTAQIVLMDGNLVQLPNIFTLGKEFAANMRSNFLVATVPSFAIIGGIFFLGWGLLTSTLLYQVSVPFALYNTVRPLLVQTQQIGADSAPAINRR